VKNFLGVTMKRITLLKMHKFNDWKSYKKNLIDAIPKKFSTRKIGEKS